MSSSSSYALRGLMAHLHATQDWPRLFALLETKPFLADQAERLGGFQASGDDLETYALPAAIAAQDWPRFLHYAALALNLRGLAEDLAAPEILRALARRGDVSLALALDAAGRLTNPLRQARALAAVASGCEDESARQDVLRQLEGRLDDLARDAPGRASVEDLAVIAREVGPDLHTRWPGWIERFVPDHASRIWQAVAEGWLRRGDPLAPQLWQALTALGNSSLVLALAPAALGTMDLMDSEEVLRRLESLLSDPQDRQRAGAILLGQWARRHPDRACAAWEAWSTRSTPVWSPELIDSARHVVGLQEPSRIEEIAASIQDPAPRAALRIVVLEARRTAEAASAALAELRNLPDGPGKLHRSLRYLAARPAEPKDEVRRQIIAIGRHLHTIGFAVTLGDLARWLDLVALHLSDLISAQFDAVLGSPGLTSDDVLALAEALTHPQPLALLLDRAERCAAALCSTEVEGFVFRKTLLIIATCRHCLLTQSLDALHKTAERLLPEEEDELRSLLAPRLAKLADNGAPLAEEVCEQIGDRRLRLITSLRSAPEIPPESLTPPRLYEALAHVESLQDEHRGLLALLETPHDPRELLQRHILPIREPRIRTRALLRLARHTLAFEIACYDRPDRLAPLELVRWLLTTETDEELASLTPEIAALGAAAGGGRALAEVQEAARRLAGLETVPWPARRDALEDLLTRVADGLLPPRQWAKALVTILRLPRQLRPESARQQLRQHWVEILPFISAAAERLPDRYKEPVDRALRENLSDLHLDSLVPAKLTAPRFEEVNDPSAPRSEAFLTHLWNDPEKWRSALSWTVQDALRQGRPQGEAALRLWLHAHLAPSLGSGRRQGSTDAKDAERSLQAALRLGPERTSA